MGQIHNCACNKSTLEPINHQIYEYTMRDRKQDLLLPSLLKNNEKIAKHLPPFEEFRKMRHHDRIQIVSKPNYLICSRNNLITSRQYYQNPVDNRYHSDYIVTSVLF
jgi:hypothetical protein